MANRELSCEERIDAELADELATLRRLLDMYYEDCEAYTDDGDSFESHALSFDFVAPRTFTDQEEEYFRYQISWGGPSDEFRFFVSDNLAIPDRVEYWYMDWFDGAHRVLTGEDEDLLLEVYEFYFEINGTEMYDEAMEDYYEEYPDGEWEDGDDTF